jgi:HPt (histidine-containing phosphotransfer) domain-containing protein
MTPGPVVDWPQLLLLRELQDPSEPDVVADLVATFLTDSAVRMARARAALAAGDAKGVMVEAHTLKGSAALLAAEPLRRAAERVERAANAGSTGLAAGLLDDLAATLAEVRGAFEAGVPSA